MTYQKLTPWVAVSALTVLFAGCQQWGHPTTGKKAADRTPPQEAEPINGDSATKFVFLSQNWGDGETLEYYSHPHGSQLVPYSWFLELEVARDDDQKAARFRSDKNMRRLGFLPQKPNSDFGN